jgi:hypothetical protein
METISAAWEAAGTAVKVKASEARARLPKGERRDMCLMV